MVRDAAEGERPKGASGAKTSKQVCGRSSGGAGGAPSSSSKQVCGCTRAGSSSAGSDAERARRGARFRARERDHPSAGRAPVPLPLPPRRERERGERPTRTPASRGGRPVLPSGVFDRMPLRWGRNEAWERVCWAVAPARWCFGVATTRRRGAYSFIMLHATQRKRKLRPRASTPWNRSSEPWWAHATAVALCQWRCTRARGPRRR